MVDPNEKIYYYFKLNPSTYVLYDSNMGTPIMDKLGRGYGSLALVGGIISRLNPKVMVYYFEHNDSTGFKLKSVYTPLKESVDIKDRKQISKKEDQKKKP